LESCVEGSVPLVDVEGDVRSEERLGQSKSRDAGVDYEDRFCGGKIHFVGS
jgi:hypothetical protein